MKNIWGEEELWIERDTWIILKQIKRNNNMLTETNVVELETKKEIKPSTFGYEIPNGVEIFDLGN